MDATDFADTPINRLLGLRLVSSTELEATVVLPPQDGVLQEYGVVHGGILTTVLDTAAVYLLRPRDDVQAMTSIDAHVSFLSPARSDAGDLVATATPVRIGRRVAVCRSELTQQGRLVAVGTFTYHLFRE